MFILIFYHILYPLREPRFPEPLLCSRKSGKDGFFSCFAKRFPKSEFCSTFSKSGFPKVDFTVAMLFAPLFPKVDFTVATLLAPPFLKVDLVFRHMFLEQTTLGCNPLQLTRD